MIAVIVLCVGVLSLAAGAAAVVRLADGAERQTVAATVAQSRFERLRGAGCSAMMSGSDTTRGVIAQWTVSTVTRGRAVALSVQFPTRTGTATRSYRTIIPC